MKIRPAADTNDVRYVTVVIRTSESEGAIMRISKRVYWVLFVYILALSRWSVNESFQFFSGYSLAPPRMIIIAVVMLNFMIDHKSMFWFTVVAGFLVDSYYSGVLGVYMALFAVIVRIIRLVRSNILQNPFTLGLVFFLASPEVSVYFVYTLRSSERERIWVIVKVLSSGLRATLMLSIVIYYILYLPLRNFARWVNSTRS